MRTYYFLYVIVLFSCISRSLSNSSLVSHAQFGDQSQTLVRLLSNVTESLHSVYNLHDSEGQSMDCFHPLHCQSPSLCRGSAYFGLYHSYINNEYQVRLAVSNNLTNWTFVRTLFSNADMPSVMRVPNSEWILITHEQWENPQSTAPCHVAFRLYYNEADLFSSTFYSTFIVPLSLSSLEGTPNIYSLNLTMQSELYVVDATVGFHYNNKEKRDVNAVGRLSNFGPGILRPEWTAYSADAYNQAFVNSGVIGNLGQRSSIINANIPSIPSTFSVQEGNIGAQPPTIWADWRLWLYVWSAKEVKSGIPEGLGAIIMLNPVTHLGSSSFGNPSVTILPCPESNADHSSSIVHKENKTASSICLFVSYFVFSEGSSPGEAGSCIFYKELQ